MALCETTPLDVAEGLRERAAVALRGLNALVAGRVIFDASLFDGDEVRRVPGLRGAVLALVEVGDEVWTVTDAGELQALYRGLDADGDRGHLLVRGAEAVDVPGVRALFADVEAWRSAVDQAEQRWRRAV